MKIIKPAYHPKSADQYGFFNYEPEENEIWHTLFKRQLDVLKERACLEYLKGLTELQLPILQVPQLNEVNKILKPHSAWTLIPVPGLIPPDDFFAYLAKKQFPVTTFIRRYEDLDYIDEPDIFHEIVGHAPMLMHLPYANFLQAFAQFILNATPEERFLLHRVFFFSVETGLIQTNKGLKIYGGGVLSSYTESIYALESHEPARKPFNPQEMMQINYGLDKMQKHYFIIEDFEMLYEYIQNS